MTMLVLTRKATERLEIGDSIVVTVLQVSHGKVRLGIEAPAEVRVLRAGLKARSPCLARSRVVAPGKG
jgi:carbon storage regulator